MKGGAFPDQPPPPHPPQRLGSRGVPARHGRGTDGPTLLVSELGDVCRCALSLWVTKRRRIPPTPPPRVRSSCGPSVGSGGGKPAPAADPGETLDQAELYRREEPPTRITIRYRPGRPGRTGSRMPPPAGPAVASDGVRVLRSHLLVNAPRGYLLHDLSTTRSPAAASECYPHGPGIRLRRTPVASG